MPVSRTLSVSRSTWAASLTPSDAVGSSRINRRGCSHIARATASSWRWPPERVLTGRVVSLSGMPSARRRSAAAVWKRVVERSIPGGSWPSSRLAAMSRFSHRARSCQTTAIPRRPAAAGFDASGSPASSMRPELGATSPAMQRTSVDLPAPFSPASATSSPARTSRSTCSIALIGPNRALSPRTASSGGSPAGGREPFEAGSSAIPHIVAHAARGPRQGRRETAPRWIGVRPPRIAWAP